MNRAPTMRFGCQVWVEHTRRRFIPEEEKDGSKKVCVWSSASYSWNRNGLTVSLCMNTETAAANSKNGVTGDKKMKRINPLALTSLALTFGLAVLVSMPMYAEDTTTYNFETSNFPGDTFTQTLGINNSDGIAGYHGATLNRGFTLVLSSKAFTNENFPGSAQTQVIAINNSSKTAGFYIDAAGNTHGFTDQRGSFLKVDFPARRSISSSARMTPAKLPATTAQRQTAPAPIMRTSLTSSAPFSSCSIFPPLPVRRPQGSTIPETFADSSWMPKEPITVSF